MTNQPIPPCFRPVPAIAIVFLQSRDAANDEAPIPPATLEKFMTAEKRMQDDIQLAKSSGLEHQVRSGTLYIWEDIGAFLAPTPTWVPAAQSYLLAEAREKLELKKGKP